MTLGTASVKSVAQSVAETPEGGAAGSTAFGIALASISTLLFGSQMACAPFAVIGLPLVPGDKVRW